MSILRNLRLLAVFPLGFIAACSGSIKESGSEANLPVLSVEAIRKSFDQRSAMLSSEEITYLESVGLSRTFDECARAVLTLDLARERNLMSRKRYLASMTTIAVRAQASSSRFLALNVRNLLGLMPCNASLSDHWRQEGLFGNARLTAGLQEAIARLEKQAADSDRRLIGEVLLAVKDSRGGGRADAEAVIMRCLSRAESPASREYWKFVEDVFQQRNR